MMTVNSLLKKIKFTENDFKEIEDAVKNAERNTNGEIALALAAESSGYIFWEIFASSVLSFLAVLSVFPLSNKIYGFMQVHFWSCQTWYLSAFYFCLFAVLSTIFYFALNIPFFDFLIIPSKVKSTLVTNRAMRHFAESGIYCTNEHSGILIFVSYFERQVRIIADSGISSKISQDMWNLIADEMMDSLSKKNVKQAYLNAIEKCSNLLAEYFPAKDENPNELSDGLVILEDEKWV